MSALSPSRVYTGARLSRISFPLGGIGSGCIGLAGSGRWTAQDRRPAEPRDRFVEEHHDLQVDLELPPRTVEPRENPF